jgi:hypothetical protein
MSPKRAEIVLGDLAQDAAHDLAGAGLGQARRPLDQVGLGDRADLGADPFPAPCAGPRSARPVHQGDIGIDALPLDVVRIADHGASATFLMGDQRRFHFGRAHPVARDVDHVIDAAGDPVIAVLHRGGSRRR